MAKAPINVTINGDYNDKDIKKAIADLKSLKDKSKETEGAFKSFSDLSGKAKLAIAGFAAAGAAAVVSFAKDSLMAASDFDEVQNKVQQVFGADGRKDLNSWAAEANKAFGLSKTAALDAASQFGIFGSSAGLAGTDLQNFTKDLVQLGGDLASFNNTSVDDALQALGAGLRGESEPLRRFGILLDDATLKSKAMELGIYSGSGALSQQQKILAAQASILAQTSAQQGDFARTADGMANTMRVVEASVENAKIEIGEGLLKAVNSVSRAFGGANGFADIIEDTGGAIAETTYGIGVLIEAIFDLENATDDAENANRSWWSSFQDFIKNRTQANDFFSVAVLGLRSIGLQEQITTETTEKLNTAWSDYRRAQQAVVKVTPDVVDALNATTNAARNTALSGAAAARALLETSIATGQVPEMARYAQRFDVAEMLANIGKEAKATGGAVSSAAKEIDKGLEGLSKKQKTYFESIKQSAEDVRDSLTDMRDSVYRTVSGWLNIGDAAEAYAERQQAVTDTLTALEEARARITKDATEEQLAELQKVADAHERAKSAAKSGAQSIVEEFVAQSKKFGEFGEKMRKLLAAGLNKTSFMQILEMGADRGGEVADSYLKGNTSELIRQTNSTVAEYDKLSQAIANESANAFYKAGLQSAIALLRAFAATLGKGGAARKELVAIIKDLEKDLQINVTTNVATPTGGTQTFQPSSSGGGAYTAPDLAAVVAALPQYTPTTTGGGPSIQIGGVFFTPFAEGGLVKGPTLGLVGEAGPELIVPLDRLGSMGGETNINLTVNAGMGTNGAEVGRQIVDALKQYNRRNGPIPVSVNG